MVSDLSGEWEQATVIGTLVSEGWGSGHGCPGLIPGEEGSVVKGHLFTSSDLPGAWEMLDSFEGDDYKRETIVATLRSGDVVEACVYSINTERVLWP